MSPSTDSAVINTRQQTQCWSCLMPFCLVAFSIVGAAAIHDESKVLPRSGCDLMQSTVFLEHAKLPSLRRLGGSTVTAANNGKVIEQVSDPEVSSLTEAWEKTYQGLVSSLNELNVDTACPRTVTSVSLLPESWSAGSSEKQLVRSHHPHQPLPPWFHYDQMLAWNVEAQTSLEDRSRLLFALDEEISGVIPSSKEFQAAYASSLSQRRLRHLEQVEGLVEVATFDCNADRSDFETSLVVQLRQSDGWDFNNNVTANFSLPNQSPSAQLYEEIQIWKQAVETTYNTLVFYTCDAPTFRTLTQVHVEEIISLDPSVKLLEFTLEVECRRSDKGGPCTGVFAEEDTEYSALPLGWKPPTWEDLEGPTMRQNLNTCFCAASYQLKGDAGPPTRQQFHVALDQTLQGLHREGFLTEYSTVESVTQVEEMDCDEEVSSLETHLLLQLQQPLYGNLTVQGISDTFQVVYNQLSLALCDQPLFRRIINVTLTDAPEDTQLALWVQAECRGCTPEDIADQAWLFGNSTSLETAVAASNQTTALATSLSGLPTVPLLTCACPYVRQEEQGRTPLVEEVLSGLNQRLEQDFPRPTLAPLFGLAPVASKDKAEMIAWLQQVDEHECHAIEETQYTSTNILVNFTGDPRRLSKRELKLLELTFQQTYNDLTYSFCDGRFRQITNIDLLILPKRLVVGGDNQTNTNATTATATSEATRFLMVSPNSTNATASFESNVTGLSPLDDDNLETTSVFRVDVECRRCPAEESENFGLFDSFERRRELQGKEMHSTMSYQVDATGTPTVVDPIAESTAKKCYCPAGVSPERQFAVSEEAFLEIFQQEVEQLANESSLVNVDGVGSVEEDPEFCVNDLIEAETVVAMDFKEHGDHRNMTLYTDMQVREAFRLAANSVRETDCAPLVKTAKKIQKVPLEEATNREMATSRSGNISPSTPSVRVEFDINCMESTETCVDFVGANSEEVETKMWDILQYEFADTSKTSELVFEPTSSPTQEPTEVPTESPVVVPTTSTPSSPPSSLQANQPSSTPIAQTLPTANSLPTPFPSPQPSPQPSPPPSGALVEQPTPQPTLSPIGRPSASPSESPSTGEPTAVITPQPSSGQTTKPTFPPTMQPSDTPSSMPSPKPTFEPTGLPSTAPTIYPSQTPSGNPTSLPSIEPTPKPTFEPTLEPSELPSSGPTSTPTMTSLGVAPSADPSGLPSLSPTQSPTEVGETHAPTTLTPTGYPSGTPSSQPSDAPSSVPSPKPTFEPTGLPSAKPTIYPSQTPSGNPTSLPLIEPTPKPTFEPTLEPSELPSRGPTSTPTTTSPSIAPSPDPSESPSMSPTLSLTEVEETHAPMTLTPMDSPSGTPSSQPLDAPSSVPSPKPTFEPTGLPTAAPTTYPSQTPSGNPTGLPSIEPTPKPTFEPTSEPSELPSSGPTSTPTTTSPSVAPSPAPSLEPTASPSKSATASPTIASNNPSSGPSGNPSAASEHPSIIPTGSPLVVSDLPSMCPTLTPTVASGSPSNRPSAGPSDASGHPSVLPTTRPTSKPSSMPSSLPTSSPPSSAPTFSPTWASDIPSGVPTGAPSENPTAVPTAVPTDSPSRTPTVAPTSIPTRMPTSTPSATPSKSPSTGMPSSEPSLTPTVPPTKAPTQQPSGAPIKRPTGPPTVPPSKGPTATPTAAPTASPTQTPTAPPTKQPSKQPTEMPTNLPTRPPTVPPTKGPTVSPTAAPTASPTQAPTAPPTKEPSKQPTEMPTKVPTRSPSSSPTKGPTKTPTGLPTAFPTQAPTDPPTKTPSTQPTATPTTKAPTGSPTAPPTKGPTKTPSSSPTATPTPAPTIGGQVQSYTLLNTDTGADIDVPVTDGSTLNLANLPSNMSIRAETDPSPVGGVPDAGGVDWFDENGYVRTEFHYPYSLGSNTDTNNYFPARILNEPGLHTITAKTWVYDSNAPGGYVYVGTPYVVELTIIAAPTVSPTNSPTKLPTSVPTKTPTAPPSKAPTNSPTGVPTKAPTKVPTPTPTTDPPTKTPTQPPTFINRGATEVP